MLSETLANNYANILPFNVFNSLITNKKLSIEIGKLDISNFNYKNGALGSFKPKISKIEIANELLLKYKNDIKNSNEFIYK